MHTSLDGFVAGPDGEMDWIKTSAEMFEYTNKLTDEADTALYGRVTYEMMESYWPTAADQPAATKHDIEHSRWYNKVDKIVLSRTMQDSGLKNTRIIRDNVSTEISKLKRSRDSGSKDILVFGSPSAVHSLLQENLVDDFWLFVNPIILGRGIPLFAGMKEKLKLKLLFSKVFSSGVAGLHYEKEF
jgi:dihydrofolate reductase